MTAPARDLDLVDFTGSSFPRNDREMAMSRH
jgi:hypothetical protein